MTREEARKAAQVMLAYANGERIERYDDSQCEWEEVKSCVFDWSAYNYRVKPKEKFDPTILKPFDKVLVKSRTSNAYCRYADLLPKKIYLNYVDESDTDKTWSEEPISVCDCQMQNREYTDLSSLWHDASEHPAEVGAILYCTTLGSFELVVHGTSSEDMWKVFVKDYGVVQWAYINDLLPKTKEL